MKPLRIVNPFEEMMAELDENGDGIINYEEFEKNMMKMLEKGHYDQRKVPQSQFTRLETAD